MDTLHERVGGLDVHKATIVACVRIMADGQVTRECRSFETTTSGLSALLQWLRERGIYTAIHYPVPVHLPPAYRFLGYKMGDFPVAEELAQTSLSLPLFPGLRDEEQGQVVEAVKRFFR